MDAFGFDVILSGVRSNKRMRPLVLYILGCEESKQAQIRLQLVDTVYLKHDIRAYGSWRSSQLIQTDSMSLFVGLEARSERSILFINGPRVN